VTGTASCYSDDLIYKNNKWSKTKRPHRRLLTPRRCEWIRPIFTPSNLLFYRPTWISPPNGVSVGVAVFAYVLPFSPKPAKSCAYSAFQWAGQFPKLPIPNFRWLTDLDPYLIMIPWAYPSHPPKRHLDRFIRFCRAHKRDQHTVTRTVTDHATPSVVTAVGRL